MKRKSDFAGNLNNEFIWWKLIFFVAKDDKDEAWVEKFVRKKTE
jgi:hypothetical protein